MLENILIIGETRLSDFVNELNTRNVPHNTKLSASSLEVFLFEGDSEIVVTFIDGVYTGHTVEFDLG